MLKFDVILESGKLPEHYPTVIHVPIGWNDLTLGQFEKMQAPGLRQSESLALALGIPTAMLNDIPGNQLRDLTGTYLAFLNDRDFLEALAKSAVNQVPVKEKYIPTTSERVLHFLQNRFHATQVYTEKNRVTQTEWDLICWQALLSMCATIYAAYTLEKEKMLLSTDTELEQHINERTEWARQQPVPKIWGLACQYVRLFAQDLNIPIMQRQAPPKGLIASLKDTVRWFRVFVQKKIGQRVVNKLKKELQELRLAANLVNSPTLQDRILGKELKLKSYAQTLEMINRELAGYPDNNGLRVSFEVPTKQSA